ARVSASSGLRDRRALRAHDLWQSRLARNPENRGQAPLDIIVGRCPRGHADPHRRVALPVSAATPASALRLHLLDYATRALRAAEADQHLIQHDLVQDPIPSACELLGEALCVAARSLDELRHTRATQVAQGRPYLDPPRAAREIGGVLIRDALLGLH